MAITDRQPTATWAGRSLDNYKAIHKAAAETKGVGAELAMAKTLTHAKKIVFGMKRGNIK